MIRKNFHTHTLFCDGADTPEQIVQAAIAEEMTALGFSAHSFTDFDLSYCIKPENISVYKNEIRELKRRFHGKINIYCGFELDLYSSTAAYKDADYIIGSAHYIKLGKNFLSVDESRERQIADADRFFSGSLEKYAAAYFETAAEICEKLHPDFIGHFDLVNKFNEGGNLFDSSCGIVKNAWQEAAKRLCESGVPFEINTGAIARGKRTTPYPDIDMAEFIAQHGGKFILSSDCHDKSKLLCGFEDAEKQFKKYDIIDFEARILR